MTYFICEKQGRCCSHEFYNSIEQAITDSDDGVPCDHLIEVAPVRHGKWILGKDLPYSWGQIPKNKYHLYCSECLEQAFNRSEDNDPDFDVDTSYCQNCGAKMDGGGSDEAD